jgi:SAM-dependent methyltransferase
LKPDPFIRERLKARSFGDPIDAVALSHSRCDNGALKPYRCTSSDPTVADVRDRDRAEVSHFFSESLRKYGYDPRSLGWIPGTQRARFAVLAAIGDLDGCKVLDVGCGFGDLYEYLCRRGTRVDYTGVDLNPGFVEIARARHPDARFVVADFEDAKVDGRFDWAFGSGIFSFRVSDHEAFVGRMLRKMFDNARKGVAIDFLDGRCGPGSAALYHPDPADVYRMCSRLSRRVVLRCDYKPTEFCVYVYREAEEGPGNVYRGYDGNLADLAGRRTPGSG